LSIARRLILEIEGINLKKDVREGYHIIGLGHKILKGEGIEETITEEDAWSLLDKDLDK
jgi:hypothetical protein